MDTNYHLHPEEGIEDENRIKKEGIETYVFNNYE